MNNKPGQGGQHDRGGTAVQDEEKKNQGGNQQKEQGKTGQTGQTGQPGQHKPEQGKEEFRHQEKGGNQQFNKK